MKSHLRVLTTAFLLFSCVLRASAQVDESPNIAGTPPKMLLLVRQQFKSGKARERRKLEVAVSRACDQLAVPNSWIDLESISGSPQALFFDSLDSFEQLDNAFPEWSRILASRPDIARVQEEIQALVSTERTMIVVRRDESRLSTAVHRLFQSPLYARARSSPEPWTRDRICRGFQDSYPRLRNDQSEYTLGRLSGERRHAFTRFHRLPAHARHQAKR